MGDKIFQIFQGKMDQRIHFLGGPFILLQALQGSDDDDNLLFS